MFCLSSIGYGSNNNIHKYTNKIYNSTSPKDIEIHTTYPIRPYIKIAEIILYSTNTYKLEIKAAKLGADAVIINTAHKKESKILKATAIKYTDIIIRKSYVNINMYTNKAYKPTNLQKIHLYSFTALPTKKYTEIAYITLYPKDEYKLKSTATKLGANAVIILEKNYGELKAIAIKI